ncbi:MAG TPA: fumarylacetoacetate hydrolase family protein [Burkholderiales bacterium]|jgi:2-keto-4-pentenoate hydratase/2-oxohepta-3-ene-1,7-dioic acid hydratase in catechol pathway|nr:fumarylacetoacetate hydrolase family protein [Burkholderiales bacterium]
MKLVSYLLTSGDAAVGAVLDGRVLRIDDLIAALEIPAAVLGEYRQRGQAVPAGGMLRLLAAGPLAHTALTAALRQAPASLVAAAPLLQQVQLQAPVPRPGKIMAVGRNYADHAKETGVDPFEKPRIIGKMPSSVLAPGVAVVKPAAVHKLDFEVELAAVIGSHAHLVPRERALDHVAGYTVLNDVSAREFQFDVSPPQTTFAKSMDGFCPMGPWMVTRDEVPDPQSLTVRLWLNGELMQEGHTKDMLFPLDFLISYLSQYMTLEPGDIIATGTPAGIGAFRKPPLWLKAGDALKLECSGVGVLEHGIA